jgi:2-polyprenyl-3-methyl-5-hydroxy-6-metoxy-1,4-benzoquinol methylase
MCDVRLLDQREDLKNQFAFIICCENIEHILDDKRLIKAMYACLKPGGKLLLTAPNNRYRPISPGDEGPFSKEEDGWHVRKGYFKDSIRDLFADTGFVLANITFCSGLCSQKTTWILRQFPGKLYIIGWFMTLPLRPLIPFWIDALTAS